MKHHFPGRILMWMGAVIFIGCATTQNPNFTKGQRHLQQTEYDQAIVAFEKARKENPDDLAVKRELAVAYYHKKQFAKAIPLLVDVIKSTPHDEKALFYLGISYESFNDISHALDMYQSYLDVSTNKNLRKTIEAKVAGLERKQMAEEAKATLAREQSINPAVIPDNTIAVLYFKNIGGKRELDPIQKGLTDMLTTDLSKVKKLQVVERVQMQKMLDELGMGQSGMVEDKSAPRVGKLLGASKLVHGSFKDIAKDGLRIDADFVEVKKGNLSNPDKVQGKLAELFKMEKDLVFNIVTELGIKLSTSERDEIKIIPTENLLAFMAYCNGLDREDKGLFKEAAQEYQKAAKLDPQFKNAVQGVSRSEKLTISNINSAKLEGLYDQTSSSSTTTASSQPQKQKPATTTRAEAPLVDQMMHTAAVLDQGFLPGIDSRKATLEENQSSFGNAASFNVRITLPTN